MFDECFVVHGIRLIEGDNGLFIVMPAKKTPTGEHKDIAHPLNQETRKEIQEKIIEAYNAAE